MLKDVFLGIGSTFSQGDVAQDWDSFWSKGLPGILASLAGERQEQLYCLSVWLVCCVGFFVFCWFFFKCSSDFLEGWSVELLKNNFVGKRPWDMNYPVTVCDV